MSNDYEQADMPVNIVIDGAKFSSLEEFYDEMDNLLTRDLTWKTGHNLDAFNDLLRGGFGVHEYGQRLNIKWINFSKSKRDFGYEATVRYYEHCLEICHPTSKQIIEKKLADAKNNVGPTLLDIIVEIILDTDNSGHFCSLVTEE